MPKYVPFIRLWAHYMGGFFIKAWLDTVAGSKFVPADKNDFRGNDTNVLTGESAA